MPKKNNSRSRKLERRRVALKSRKKQLVFWKRQIVNKNFSEEKKKRKILLAQEQIEILETRV